MKRTRIFGALSCRTSTLIFERPWQCCSLQFVSVSMIQNLRIGLTRHATWILFHWMRFCGHITYVEFMLCTLYCDMIESHGLGSQTNSTYLGSYSMRMRPHTMICSALWWQDPPLQQRCYWRGMMASPISCCMSKFLNRLWKIQRARLLLCATIAIFLA